MPIDSATVRAERGTHWTELEYLTADLVDLCQAIFAVLVSRFSDGKQRVPIEPVDRPTVDRDEDDEETPGRMSIDEALAAMRQMTPHHPHLTVPALEGRDDDGGK